jgi:hypothetical protein
MPAVKKFVIILFFALIGWICCAAIMGIGMSILPQNTTLIIHLIAAPIIFFIISSVYYKKFNFTSPFITALFFMSFIIFMDFFVVALLIMKSFEMFKSLIGTWIPFILIFLSTFLTGKLIKPGNKK